MRRIIVLFLMLGKLFLCSYLNANVELSLKPRLEFYQDSIGWNINLIPELSLNNFVLGLNTGIGFVASTNLLINSYQFGGEAGYNINIFKLRFKPYIGLGADFLEFIDDYTNVSRIGFYYQLGIDIGYKIDSWIIGLNTCYQNSGFDLLFNHYQKQSIKTGIYISYIFGEERYSEFKNIKKIENKVKFDIPNILYDLNSSRIKNVSEVEKIVDNVIKYKPKKIVIVGHSDDSGSYKYNLTLSRKRAKSVYSLFIKKGYRNVSFEGKGDKENIYKEKSKNRRVEIVLEE